MDTQQTDHTAPDFCTHNKLLKGCLCNSCEHHQKVSQCGQLYVLNFQTIFSSLYVLFFPLSLEHSVEIFFYPTPWRKKKSKRSKASLWQSIASLKHFQEAYQTNDSVRKWGTEEWTSPYMRIGQILYGKDTLKDFLKYPVFYELITNKRRG